MNIHDVDPSEISLAEQSQRTKKLFSVRFQMIVAGYKFGATKFIITKDQRKIPHHLHWHARLK